MRIGSTLALLGASIAFAALAEAQSCPPQVLHAIDLPLSLRATARAGDLDLDGTDDYLIGGALHSSWAGSVFAVSAHTGNVLWEAVVPDPFRGMSLASIGDVNGDRVPDVACGIPHGMFGALSEYVAVLDGWNGALIRGLRGAPEENSFGAAVVGVGDLDGDGRADFVVGAPGTSRPPFNSWGAVIAYSGWSLERLWRIDGPAVSTGFGQALASGWDLDHNGTFDLAVFDPHADPAGRVSVYALPQRRMLWTFRVPDEESYPDNRPNVLAMVGDLNGDGVSEIAIGDDGYGSRDPHPGYVYVLSGRSGALLLRLAGETDQSYFGRSIAPLGDIDRDGIPEFAVGAPAASPRGDRNAGTAYLFSGRGPAWVARFDGVASDTYNAEYLGGGGDLDGDGNPDLVVGTGRSRVLAVSFAGHRVYGTGLAGTRGEPILSLRGDTRWGGEAKLHATNSARRRTSALLILGARPISDPVAGGTLLAQPDVLIPVDLAARGGLVLRVPVPRAPLLLCESVYAQILESDPRAPWGISMSRGLQIVLRPR